MHEQKEVEEMIERRFLVAVVLSMAVLSGCAPVISSEWRNEARKDLTFSMALRDPTAYTGSIVIWGGIIIGIANHPDGTALAVLETPLTYRERPRNSAYSSGRFIATTPQFLDPAVFRRGRMITLAGEIIGKETRPLGKSEVQYTYPVVRVKQIVLWEPEYAPPADYWWYEDSDFWSDEGFDSNVRDKGRGSDSR
jgi:outer membrane lipoprotein